MHDIQQQCWKNPTLVGGGDNFRSTSVTRNKMPVSNSKVQCVHDIVNVTTLI